MITGYDISEDLSLFLRLSVNSSDFGSQPTVN